jgi:hypothetical protein
VTAADACAPAAGPPPGDAEGVGPSAAAGDGAAEAEASARSERRSAGGPGLPGTAVGTRSLQTETRALRLPPDAEDATGVDKGKPAPGHGPHAKVRVSAAVQFDALPRRLRPRAASGLG